MTVDALPADHPYTAHGPMPAALAQRADSATTPDDRIDAATAAALQGLPLSSFNAARRQMQLVRDRGTGRLLSYPDLSHDELGNLLTAAERRRREVAFDAANIVVVPEWGGIKYPRSTWTYSRRLCEGIRDQHVAALERPAWMPRE